MVIELVKRDLGKILDKNAILMSIMAFVCIFMANFFNTDLKKSSSFISIIKVDAFLILFLMFLIELSKNTLVDDKIGKKIEFIIVNGMDFKYLILKYAISLFIGTWLVLIPSFLIIILKDRLGIFIIGNILISSLLFSFMTVLFILFTIDMNKINGLFIKLTLLFISTIIVSSLTYRLSLNHLFYFIIKYVIFITIIMFLGIKTNKERIVISYY